MIEIDTNKLALLIAKHQSVYPALGEVKEQFLCDGFPCCRWSNGDWYHYDTRNDTWF